MTQPVVLVVEDEDDIREALVTYLRRGLDGVAVLGAGGVRDAKQMLRLGPVHLVLTDHFMPDGTGTEFLEHVREQHPKAVRMLMTAFPESDVLVEACNAAKVEHIFTKPLEPLEVATRVMQALEAGGAYGGKMLHPTR